MKPTIKRPAYILRLYTLQSFEYARRRCFSFYYSQVYEENTYIYQDLYWIHAGSFQLENSWSFSTKKALRRFLSYRRNDHRIFFTHINHAIKNVSACSMRQLTEQYSHILILQDRHALIDPQIVI